LNDVAKGFSRLVIFQKPARFLNRVLSAQFPAIPAYSPVAHNPAGAADQHGEHQRDASRHTQRYLVPPQELAKPIAHRRRTGLHRLVRQVALHVHREAVGRLVAAGWGPFPAPPLQSRPPPPPPASSPPPPPRPASRPRPPPPPP